MLLNEVWQTLGVSKMAFFKIMFHVNFSMIQACELYESLFSFLHLIKSESCGTFCSLLCDVYKQICGHCADILPFLGNNYSHFFFEACCAWFYQFIC